jgi:hypothetical protein
MAKKRKAADKLKPRSNGEKQVIDWSGVDNIQYFNIECSSTQRISKAQNTSPQVNGIHYNLVAQDAPLAADFVQLNPFRGVELSAVHTKISPPHYWESMGRYMSCISKSY